MKSKKIKIERIKTKNGGYRVIKRDRTGRINKNVSWGTYLKRKNIVKKRKATITKKELTKKAAKILIGRVIDPCGILEIFSEQK